MTQGIKVIWENQSDEDEIEFFYGIDTGNLDKLRNFKQVEAYWRTSEKFVTYKISTEKKPYKDGICLIVTYKQKNNEELEFIYEGSNFIYIEKDAQDGCCIWNPDADNKEYEIRWYAFDSEENQERILEKYFRWRRDSAFRKKILCKDKNQCVLSGEKTIAALEAAHLIPAREGKDDKPSNGITLRADLHKLFDANLFSFNGDGKVVVSNSKKLSKKYRKYLDGRGLPELTLKRVQRNLRRLLTANGRS